MLRCRSSNPSSLWRPVSHCAGDLPIRLMRSILIISRLSNRRRSIRQLPINLDQERRGGGFRRRRNRSPAMPLANVETPYGAYWSTPFVKLQGTFQHLHAMRFAAHVARDELAQRGIDPSRRRRSARGEVARNAIRHGAGRGGIHLPRPAPQPGNQNSTLKERNNIKRLSNEVSISTGWEMATGAQSAGPPRRRRNQRQVAGARTRRAAQGFIVDVPPAR